MSPWVEWLATVGYPFGVNFETVPPVDLMDLAHQYAMTHGDDLTADDWYAAIMREVNSNGPPVIIAAGEVPFDAEEQIEIEREAEPPWATVLPFPDRSG